ncbi:sensor histidine kinase [Pseudooceanicola sp. 502str34]
MTLTARIQLIAIGSVLATSILVLAFVSYRTDQRLQQSIGASLAARVGHHAQLVQDTVDTHLTQLHALLRGPAVAQYLATGALGQLTLRLHAQAAASPDLLQARLIDADGRERVRIDRTDDVLRIRPADELQDKSGRDYVLRTLALPRGQIYISRLDLNREGGVIQVPHVSTLRLAAPLIDANGSRRGVLVLNLRGTALLPPARLGSVTLRMTDETGSYLVHPEDGWLHGQELHSGYDFMAEFGIPLPAPPPRRLQSVVQSRATAARPAPPTEALTRRETVTPGPPVPVARADKAAEGPSPPPSPTKPSQAGQTTPSATARPVSTGITLPDTDHLAPSGPTTGVATPPPQSAGARPGPDAAAARPGPDSGAAPPAPLRPTSETREDAPEIELLTLTAGARSYDAAASWIVLSQGVVPRRWLLVVALPTEVRHALGGTDLLRTGAVTAGIALLAAGCALLLIHGTTRRLTDLSEIADRLAAGDRGVAIEVQGRDEVGRLARALNQMTAQLHITLSRETRAKNLLQIANTELRRSNGELEDFARAAAHDLKTPLRALCVLPTWIEEDLGAIHGPLAAHLSEMRAQTTRLEALVDGLLTYSLIGRDRRGAETFDPAPVVARIVATLSPPAGFRIEAPDLPATVRMVPTEFEIALRNLLQNAIQHHDRQDGQITIRLLSPRNSIVLEVEDDGPGIPEADRARLMLPLRTGKTREEGGGSGLGLAFVAKIAARWGGCLEIEDAPNRGTRLRLSLPADLQDPKDRHDPETGLAA